ncbi:MAG: type II secretion system minor pseudopilin GspK, partial [Pacificimonas sp.]
MALITVLMLVAVMGALTATTLEVMSRSVAMAANGRSAMQGHHYARGAGLIVAERVAALKAASPDRLTLAGGWSDTPVTVPTATGSITIRLSDASHCFNLNSVVSGAAPNGLILNPLGVEQYVALAQAVGVDAARARANAITLADYIDTDPFPQGGGAEDAAYRSAAIPHLTPNGLIAHASELLAVSGVRAEDYAAMRPYLCALGDTGAAIINLNTMGAGDAPLLAMLAPGQISAAQARQAVAARPDTGWQDREAFWTQPA